MHNTDALARVARLFQIVTLIRSHSSPLPLGRTALAEACRCTERTTARDLNLLVEAGIPIYFDPARRAYTLPDQSGWIFPVAALVPEDALALALARAIAGGPGVPHQHSILATLDKLTRSLSPALRVLLEQAAAGLHAGRPARDYSLAPLDALVQAAQAKQSVEIEYHSRHSGECAWRRVDPYRVAARDGQFWEMHGWCHRRQQVRTFALDGVRGVRSAAETFTVREAEWARFVSAPGVVGGLRGGAQVDVRASFSAKVASYALGLAWEDGLTVTARGDGTALLTGMAQGTDGLVVELLRWRRHVRVEGGPELVAAMRDEARAIAALYEEN